MPGTNDAKRALRREMRAVRRRAAGVPGRSEAIVARLVAIPELARARTVMLFDARPGEPDLGRFADRLRERGITVVVPEAHPAATLPAAPTDLDVVVVPGLAFAVDGHRLGQGGGWYDRVLAAVRPDCGTIGVCFDEQIRDVPVEPHDVRVRWVVTPSRTMGVALPAPGPSET